MSIVSTLSHQIKEKAYALGFDACGITRAHDSGEASYVMQWLEHGYAGEMTYLHNHFDKRINPTVLVDGAKSIISVALNYYPQHLQSASAPQFAYYAYGKDYHDVVKNKLRELLAFIQTLNPNVQGRAFCDSAPVLERYWAEQAGLGFIGKNGLLIIPRRGSYFFLGELIVDIPLSYDYPLGLSCGTCNACLDACPTQAIVSPSYLDARKCLSYQTIEKRGTLDEEVIPHLSSRVYGCDQCQIVCPWNRFAKPHTTPEFVPSAQFLALDWHTLRAMTREKFNAMFKHSAVKRTKYEGLMRNALAAQSKASS